MFNFLLPQDAKPSDFSMILVMKNREGHVAYGPGVARKAADIVAEMIQKEQAANAARNPPANNPPAE